MGAVPDKTRLVAIFGGHPRANGLYLPPSLLPTSTVAVRPTVRRIRQRFGSSLLIALGKCLATCKYGR